MAAYDAAGAEESAQQSNMATINVEFGFADTLPPDWDTTTGVQSATTNPDGTVTLSWGSATEMAPLGVQASEPVQYVVYYSTESPIDFERAARIDNIADLTWTSIPLVDGVEYYFAVRCRDSHDPSNEDANSVELLATVTGGVVDNKFPEWSESFPYALQSRVIGISKVNVEDGKLVIEHAEAIDLLSPPVYYDLYYMDASNPSEDLFPKPWPYVPNPLAQVVQDIPDKYELEWPNRSPVKIGVRARDSAIIPNQDDNDFEMIMTPGNVKITPFPKDLPGLIDVEDPHPKSEILSDPFNHRYFLAYSIPEVEPELLRIVILDAETGEWELDEVIHSPQAGKAISEVKLAFSWDRNPWLYFAASGPDRYYKRSSTGEWTEWEPARDRFWDSQYLLDHNGNPAFYSLAMASDVQSSRQKLFYEWYDETALEWKSEFVSDPGGRPSTILRPDGVLQLIVGTDSQGLGDETPTKGRLLERNLDGTWTELMSGDGAITLERFPHPTWEMEWGWVARSTINGDSELLISTSTEYKTVPMTTWPGDTKVSGFKHLPALGSYNALPSFIYDGSEHHYQKLPSTDYNSMTNFNNHYLRNYNSMFSDGGSARDLLIDPQTGFYSRVDRYQNPGTSQTEYGIFSFPDGETLFSE